MAVASREFVCSIAGAMLGMEPDQVEEDEVNDVPGKFANVACGNRKSDFLDAQLACVISTPAITCGSDYGIEASKIGEHTNE